MSEKEKIFLSSFFCESDSQEIRDLYKSIVLSKRDKRPIEAIFLWVRDNIEYTIEPKLVSAKGYIRKKTKKGNCFNKNNLFIALCRSIGIPARYAITKLIFTIKDINKKIVIPHMVAEIFYNNHWEIYDTSFGKRLSGFKTRYISVFRGLNARVLLRFWKVNIFILIFMFLFSKISPNIRRLKRYLKIVPEVNITLSE
ncbi:MAG: transglutaminase-like domain-containing protein [Candidatus Aenigmatarchaeota archaeon]